MLTTHAFYTIQFDFLIILFYGLLENHPLQMQHGFFTTTIKRQKCLIIWIWIWIHVLFMLAVQLCFLQVLLKSSVFAFFKETKL